MLDFSNINSLWGSLIVEECIRNGCDYFVVSPGSRSTPLTVAVARNERAKKIVCYDERGAAFHALGYARATGKAAVLICTSGTAAANYLPAMIEADVDSVPMLVLSSDRPPELRETMANQTIVQAGMFGSYVRWFFDMPVPTEAIAPQMPLTTIDQALYRAHDEAGPVHVNCMWREPLAPVKVKGGISAEYRNRLTRHNGSRRPYTNYLSSRKTPQHPQILPPLAVRESVAGIVVVGQLKSQHEMEAVRRFVEKVGWPVLADVTSQLRLGGPSAEIIPYFDQILLTDDRMIYPHMVIQIGGQFVSKRLLQFLERIKPSTYVVINSTPKRYDANHLVTHRVEMSLDELDDLAATWTNQPAQQPKTMPDRYHRIMLRGRWLERWSRRNEVVAEVIEAELSLTSQSAIANEGSVARMISAEIPATHALFVGNSMPIRDVDMYAVANGAAVPVAANRGASGIDGNVATAIGFAVGHDKPTTLLLGDLTLLHDLNSLSQLKHVKQPLTIVVINNGGGGIFHLLPIRQFEDVFEENFGTPHEFEFASAAQMFGLAYAQPETGEQFVAAYRAALGGGKHTIIEVRTNREANWQAHLALQAKIRTASAGAA